MQFSVKLASKNIFSVTPESKSKKVMCFGKYSIQFYLCILFYQGDQTEDTISVESKGDDLIKNEIFMLNNNLN